MPDPVPPVSPAAAARALGRGRALVVMKRKDEQAEAPEDERGAGTSRHRAAPMSAVGAQLLGEKPRRGLRAGPEVLEQARSTYLSNEFSGSRDRRPRKGQLTKTEI